MKVTLTLNKFFAGSKGYVDVPYWFNEDGSIHLTAEENRSLAVELESLSIASLKEILIAVKLTFELTVNAEELSAIEKRLLFLEGISTEKQPSTDERQEPIEFESHEAPQEEVVEEVLESSTKVDEAKIKKVLSNKKSIAGAFEFIAKCKSIDELTALIKLEKAGGKRGKLLTAAQKQLDVLTGKSVSPITEEEEYKISLSGDTITSVEE